MEAATLAEPPADPAFDAPDARHFTLSKLTPIQTRVALDEAAVREYAQSLRDGIDLPPGIVVVDVKSQRKWLAAGNHRAEAHRRAGRESMACQVFAGSRWDAFVLAVQDNRRFQGVRITRQDRKRQVDDALLANPQASGRALAALIGVDHKTVERRRQEMIEAGQIPAFETYVGVDGRARRIARPRPRIETPGPAIPPTDSLSVKEGGATLSTPGCPGPVDCIAQGAQPPDLLGECGDTEQATTTGHKNTTTGPANPSGSLLDELGREPRPSEPQGDPSRPAAPAAVSQGGPKNDHEGSQLTRCQLGEQALYRRKNAERIGNALESLKAARELFQKLSSAPSAGGPGTFAAIAGLFREAQARLSAWQREFTEP